MTLETEYGGMRVLVTGGAGFIGSHLVDALLRNGATVRVLDNLSTGTFDNLAHAMRDIQFHAGDVRELEACRRACAGVDMVFHQAALGSVSRSMAEPAATFAVNVSGTANVFAAARDAGVRRIVYASSSSVYGDSIRVLKREGEEGLPLSPYALSKKMNEELATIHARAFGMELIGLRYFNVYGPKQSPRGPYAAVIPLFFDACRKTQPLIIHGDGEQTRDFTFVSDAVQANLRAAVAPQAACGRAYNIGAGASTAVNVLASLVAKVTGASVSREYRPPRPGDMKHSQADVSDARAMLGFSPIVALAAGLERLASRSP